MFEHEETVGISAMSCYLPRLRVDLRQWCEWTSHDWDKVSAVTGRAFRMAGPDEDVYTMAATAVLRLILDNGVDPCRIGFLALGTESSTDNALGAVTVRGMIDRELRRRGMPSLPRDVEVPEYKHACLGGMYALQGAARFAALDRNGRQAVVVASDIAEYERGSSGEQTQGAGAVAMLVERSPALLAIDLGRAAGASAYRGPDFRKPAARHRVDGYAAGTQRLSDFPVFSGRYSAAAYLDAVTSAVETLWAADTATPADQLDGIQGLFIHRPYRKLPQQALSFLRVRALAASPARHRELEQLCQGCDIGLDDVLAELRVEPDLFGYVLAGQQAPDPWPATAAVSSHLRGQPAFRAFAQRVLGSGADPLVEVGNLYSASLPAWLAAGIEEAALRGVELAGAPLLAVGYGSGDAALALPVTAVEGWQAAAARIGFRHALDNPVDLDREQYEALHDRREVPGLALHPWEQFTVDRTGTEYGRDFQDLAVDYYAYEY
ncbi:hypothetical protein [Streptomyces sp. NBC_00094]|uniref:hypothetical protein n=1 Tax=Streptomyces sp. NBC_00094 TaxID=2903620 RepID=UPI002253B735|nr:hypothetical protein [Streptomyces sp. NBC_00094]MCX5389197.1 hypothetical protein [Streptomyces sp. NBC_00094]